MKKTLYILRIILFIIYLLIMFLLIDNLFKLNITSLIYFILNLIYSFIIILTILSKKHFFKKNISYNLLNIGIYIYTIMLYKITNLNTRLDILKNIAYFKNNFIMISILLISIIIYSLIINKEEKNDN